MANDHVPGDHPGNPAGFLVAKINEGLGPYQALQAFREAGGSMRSQTFSRLYGEVAGSLANEKTIGDLDPYRLPDPARYSPWTLGNGGEYVTSVNVFFRDRDTGIIGSKPYDYKTAEPHAPGEAEMAAYDDFAENSDESNYNQVIVGTTVRNIYETNAYGA